MPALLEKERLAKLEAIVPVEDPNILRVIRPRDPAKEPVFSFDLPVLVNGSKWSDSSDFDLKSESADYIVRPGGKKEPETEVVASKTPSYWGEFASKFRENNLTDIEIIRYAASGGTEDFEWVEKEFLLRKDRKIHKWAKILRDPSGKKDYILFLRTPEERSTAMKEELWNRLDSSFRRAAQ